MHIKRAGVEALNRIGADEETREARLLSSCPKIEISNPESIKERLEQRTMALAPKMPATQVQHLGAKDSLIKSPQTA